MPLPPGPASPAALQTYEWIARPTALLRRAQARYGEPFTIRTLWTDGPMVLVSDPEDVRRIFTAEPGVLRGGESSSILEPFAGPSSILLLDGPEHLRQRRLMLPPFHGERVQAYRRVVAELAEAEVASWPRGEAFAALPRMQGLTLDVIMRAVFGEREEPALRDVLRRALDMAGSLPRLVALSLVQRDLGPRSPWGRFMGAVREVDDALRTVIRERRADPPGEDILGLLLSARDEDGEPPTDAELRDQLVTLLLAGHETTASGLSWALYELGRHPELMRRAQHAVDEGDDDYLEAVMKESLRLHPVIPMVVRYLMEPVTIAGWRLPAGASIGPSILLAHQDEANFPQAQEFRPERFAKGSTEKVVPNTWIPFGGGVRRCIGAGFSLMEGVAVLREVLSTYDVGVVDGHDDKPKVRNITSVPARGARIVVQPRG
jgi:cytochrome P450 family 135